MFWCMLKKEILQFVRRKSNLIMMFLFPILLITTLGFGLESMMSGEVDIFGDDKEPSIVYYTVEDDKYKEGFLSFTKVASESASIRFEEVENLTSVIEEVDDFDAIAHINVENDGFTLYSSKNGETFKTRIFKSIFEVTLNEYSVYETIGRYNPEAFSKFVENKFDSYVTKEEFGNVKNINSKAYYTFAELALIILYSAQVIAESVYNENRLTTINRLILSKISTLQIIMAKVSLGVLIATLQSVLVYIYSTFVLKVNWGQHTVKFMILFIVLGLFASIMGAVIGYFSKKETTAGGILNVIIIFMGALGGCYTPIEVMVNIPGLSKIMYLSPIYWINTATSSMVSGLENSTYYIALFIPIAISVLCIIIYLIYVKRRESLVNG